MPERRALAPVLLLAASLALAAPAAASEALLVALDAEAAPLVTPIAAGFAAQGATVTTLAAPTRAALFERLGTAGDAPLVVYLAGRARAADGAEQLLVADQPLPLATLMARLAAARRARVVVLLDLCADSATLAPDAPPPAGFALLRARRAGTACQGTRDGFAARLAGALAARSALRVQLASLAAGDGPWALLTLADDAPLVGAPRVDATALRALADAAALGDATAAARIAALAEGGDPEAQIAYGNLCYAGVGRPKDPTLAYRWYRRAADAGSPRGQYLVGYLLERGDGTTADLEEAVRWYRLAAAGGIGDASKALVRLGR